MFILFAATRIRDLDQRAMLAHIPKANALRKIPPARHLRVRFFESHHGACCSKDYTCKSCAKGLRIHVGKETQCNTKALQQILYIMLRRSIKKCLNKRRRRWENVCFLWFDEGVGVNKRRLSQRPFESSVFTHRNRSGVEWLEYGDCISVYALTFCLCLYSLAGGYDYSLTHMETLYTSICGQRRMHINT